MALSFTSARDLAGTLTGNSQAQNLATMDILVNLAYRQLLGEKDWGFTYRDDTIVTVASQQFYQLPAKADRVKTVTLESGTTIYSPRESPSRRHWESLNSSNVPTSDSPVWWFQFNDQVGFWPNLASASNTITVYFKQKVRDLSVADHTTETILTLTNAGGSVIGEDTAWTDGMDDKFIRIDHSNATKTGDGLWYEIFNVDDSSTISLLRNYGGVDLASGSVTYTVGDLFLMPENTHELPVYRAVEQYFTSIKPDVNQAALYKRLYDEGLDRMIKEHGSQTTGNVISDADGFGFPGNPNFFVEL